MTVARRMLAIGTVAALHVALCALLLISGTRAAPPARAATIAVRAVPSAMAVPRAVPPAPVFAVIAADIPMPTLDAETTADECALIGTITAALIEDREVSAALATQRDATALMVWDGGWSTDLTPAIAPIRRIVVDQIRQSSTLCRSAEMVGPRLFMVADGTKTVAVAIGSGTWAWRQLL
jgi:hypothetical protein